MAGRRWWSWRAALNAAGLAAVLSTLLFLLLAAGSGSQPQRPAAAAARKRRNFRFTDGQSLAESSSATANAQLRYGVRLLFEDLRLPRAVLAAHLRQRQLLRFDAAAYKAMFASALWLEAEQAFLVVCRLFVWHKNSFLYACLFDAAWQPACGQRRLGSLLLPAVLDVPVSDCDARYAGPEDPRLFRLPGGQLACLFNQADADGHRKQWLFNFESGAINAFRVDRYADAGSGRLAVPRMEKNWSPIVSGGRLLMLYNYSGFQLMDCTAFDCVWAAGVFDPQPGPMKGGSPFQRYRQTEYFFSLAYTNIKHPLLGCNVYRPALAVVRVQERGGGGGCSVALVHSGKLLNFDNLPFLAPMTGLDAVANGDVCIQGKVLTVPSIAKADAEADVVVVTLNVNDGTNLAAKIVGLHAYIAQIIGQQPQQPQRDAAYYARKHYLKSRF